MVAGKGAHPESWPKRWPGGHGTMETVDGPPSPSGPAAANAHGPRHLHGGSNAIPDCQQGTKTQG